MFELMTVIPHANVSVVSALEVGPVTGQTHTLTLYSMTRQRDALPNNASF